MIKVEAFLAALDAPALLVSKAGRVIARNAAFDRAGADVEQLRQLRPGERIETLSSPGGVLTAWRAAALAEGLSLITGEALATGPTQRDRYLASLSHELRTPLNGVLGMADLLAHTRLAADQRAYLDALQESGRHLLGLVNDVLDLARLDAGEFTLHPAPVEPRNLLQSIAELLSPRATAKGLEIGWTATPLPVISADEGRLRQILFNLAGNAVKFTETGGVLLSVERRSAGRRARLRFNVVDTGPGVAEADRERIFQPFVHAHGDRLRSDSAGLGLAIVRRLAAAHGGLVGVEARAEGGSCFFFEADFEIARATPRSRGPLIGRNIAIVSPSVIVREAAGGLVAAAGGRASVFERPDQAAAKAAPDAVMLIDHACAAAGARKQARTIEGRACVVLLAPEDRARIPAYRRAGFAGYLIKPLRAVSLVERVLAASGAAARADADERAAAQARSESGAGARVLLVEDNPINAILARSLLEREGCVVDRAESGEAALTATQNQAYDLILMDLRMPGGMDGLTAAKALRARGLRMPIIALTANAFEEDRRACLSVGMDDFLTKPLSSGALRAILMRWTGAGPLLAGPAIKSA
jgi:signal transduction histidine kinase/CheY-like chemotaxis protein